MKKLLKVEDVAELLGVANSWVYRKVKEGVIPPVPHTGRYVRFNPDDIEALFFGSNLKTATNGKPRRNSSGNNRLHIQDLNGNKGHRQEEKDELWPV